MGRLAEPIQSYAIFQNVDSIRWHAQGAQPP